ncbi:MAG: hypothetical protein SF187_02830 [Deltaproteobacteria bacterium]|nr:hypothetical protein [Deltaproteobacteria bacterium]
MSRNLTPLPARTGRAGTFDGMEKLFFERAAAIEAGEMTAPPEVIGVPRTRWRRWLGQLAALELYQKLGIAAGVLFMVLAAVLAFRGGQARKSAEPSSQIVAPPPTPTEVQPSPAKAPAVAAAKKPSTVTRPAGTARKAPSRHARAKHARTSKPSTRR